MRLRDTKDAANHALQRTRRERRGCNRGVPRAGSLSLGRLGHFARHATFEPFIQRSVEDICLLHGEWDALHVGGR